eukprot:6027227-Amphidinium_carterae.1
MTKPGAPGCQGGQLPSAVLVHQKPPSGPPVEHASSSLFAEEVCLSSDFADKTIPRHCPTLAPAMPKLLAHS